MPKTAATGRTSGGEVPDSTGPSAAGRILVLDAAGSAERQRLDVAERWLAVHARSGEAATAIEYRLGMSDAPAGHAYLIDGEPCDATAIAAAIIEQLRQGTGTWPAGLTLLAAVPTPDDLQAIADTLRCPVTAPDRAVWGHRGGVVAAAPFVTDVGSIRLGTPGQWVLATPNSPSDHAAAVLAPAGGAAPAPEVPVALADERWEDLLAGVEPGTRAEVRPLDQLAVEPDHSSTAEERLVLRIWQGYHHELSLRAVIRRRVDNPRAGQKMDEAEATDLAAVRLFIESQAAPSPDAGRGTPPAGLAGEAPEAELDSVVWPESGPAAQAHAGCLVSGLNRLPVFRGPVRVDVDAASAAAFAAGQVVRVRRPLVTTPPNGAVEVPSDRIELVIWSASGRRADGLLDEESGGTVLFPPGAVFRVLAIEEAGRGRQRVFLAEVPERRPRYEPEAGTDARTLDRLRAALVENEDRQALPGQPWRVTDDQGSLITHGWQGVAGSPAANGNGRQNLNGKRWY